MSNEIRELAMRLVDEQIGEFGAAWLSDNKVCADGVDVERLVRGAMREALYMAAEISRDGESMKMPDFIAKYKVASLESAIRAEADKLNAGGGNE